LLPFDTQEKMGNCFGTPKKTKVKKRRRGNVGGK
jgi:hypothetical protein